MRTVLTVGWLMVGWLVGPEVPANGLAAGDASLEGSSGESTEASPSEESEEVRCPACDSRGKAPCPTCNGRGELFRPCETCRGGGTRACPVCAKSNDPQVPPTPGRVPCGYCGARGTLGDTGRTCTRCGGTQALVCETCSGKGTVACRKEVFVKVCPACRYLGRVTCPLCGGTTRVSPAVLAARKASMARAALPTEARSGEQSGPASPAGGSPSTKNGSATREDVEQVEVVPTFPEIQERYAKLVPVCEAHYDIFVEDLTPKADAVRTDAARLRKKLLAEGMKEEEGTVAELGQLMERVDSFRDRWREVRELFDEERRSYTKLKNNMEQRHQTLQDTPEGLRAEVEAQWNERLALLLRILEKNSIPIQQETPDWIPAEIAGMESAMAALRKRGESELADRVALRIALGADKPQKASSKEPSQRKIGKAGPSLSGTSSRSPGTSTFISPAAPSRGPAASGAGGSADEEASQVGTARRAELGKGAPGPRSRPEGPAGGGEDTGGSSGLLWALLGFGAATVLFIVGPRLRGRARPPEPPPETENWD